MDICVIRNNTFKAGNVDKDMGYKVKVLLHCSKYFKGAEE